MARPPAERIAAAVDSTSAARSSATTAAPSAANNMALARPMPLAAPVTIADLSFNMFMLRSIAAWFISGNKGSREPWTAARRRRVFQAASVVPILIPHFTTNFRS
jgi:hypothetical protein